MNKLILPTLTLILQLAPVSTGHERTGNGLFERSFQNQAHASSRQEEQSWGICEKIPLKTSLGEKNLVVSITKEKLRLHFSEGDTYTEIFPSDLQVTQIEATTESEYQHGLHFKHIYGRLKLKLLIETKEALWEGSDKTHSRKVEVPKVKCSMTTIVDIEG